MVPRVILYSLLCCATLPLVSRAAIDFTPTPHLAKLESGFLEQISFKSGSQKILYTPPAGWRLEAKANRLRMTPASGVGEASIRCVPIYGRTVRDELTLRALRADLVAALPAGVQGLTWAEDIETPLLLNRRETVRLTGTYQLEGRNFCTTAILCYFRTQAVAFELTARVDDFEKLYATFQQSLYSWEGLD